MSHLNVSNIKIENLTNFIMLFPFLISISYYHYFFMIDKVT